VGKERQAAGRFDLIGDPIPVPHAFEGDGCTLRQVLQECPDGAGLVMNPGLLAELPILIENSELRVVLVSVASDPIIHGSCTFLRLRARRKPNCDEDSGRCSTFI
jgi:hypothetical protein